MKQNKRANVEPGAVRTRGQKLRTAGACGISQLHSRIYDSGPLRCLRKKNQMGSAPTERAERSFSVVFVFVDVVDPNVY